MTAIVAIPGRHGKLSASRAFELASDYHRRGNLQEATALYRQTLSIVPDHFGALCGIGMIKGQLGQVDDGLTALRAAARVAHDSADAHAGVGMILSAFDRGEEAIERYNCALAINPDHAGAHYNLANTLHALGDSEAAVTHYMKALAVEPNNAAAHHNLGRALQRLGRWQPSIDHHEKALQIKPELAEAHASLGNAHRVLGHLEQATLHYTKALTIRPDFAEVHNDIAGVLYKLGQNDAAIIHYGRAIATKPGYVEAHYNLGNVVHQLGRHGDAILHYETALRLRPAFAEAHNNLGNALQKLGRYQEAIARYESAITLKMVYPDAHHNLGNALLSLGRREEAIAEYSKALAIDPSKVAVHQDVAAAQLALGNLEAAYAAYEKAIASAPRNAAAHLNLANLKSFTPDDPRLAALQTLAEDAYSLPENDQIALHFALGKAMSDIGMNERSFAHWLEGNRLRRRQISYDEKSTLSALARVQDVFTAGVMRDKSGSGDPASAPVFIVGMPRSGTSLLEQILASHSRVFGAGELDAFARATDRALVGFPVELRKFRDIAAEISPEQLGRLGQLYRESVAAIAPGSDRIVDKMPANFAYVGLIHLALPNARIIHARRDPVDTCLSCFASLFASEQPHTYDLAELGRYYTAYARMMRHWEQVLPPGVMLDVRYEDVVDDIEGQARRLISHCGLEWEDQCLTFHQTIRAVRNPSVSQIRRPIFRNSVGRGVAYTDLLEPLLAALETDR